MKKILFFALLFAGLTAFSQEFVEEEYIGGNCTSIMVGKKASADGSVITSHTCDGRYRTWMRIEPAADHKKGETHKVYRGTMHTKNAEDTTGVRLMGEIPQAEHTYAYLNTAYPCMNEKQLAIGETTFSGPDTLVNEKGMFTIEELERVALMRCTTARDAIKLIGELIAEYGYGDGGECITIADKNEVWQMEILGEGPEKIGGVWAAKRIPDNHVGVSANIPRIGLMERDNPDFFMASDNVEAVAKKYGLWDGVEPFVFWKAFNASYAQGKNFKEREFFILSSLAPSLNLSMDMPELPFSVQPDENVDVRKVIALFRSTYEGTDLDMTQNIKYVKSVKQKDGSVVKDTVVSPVANPWLTSTMMNTLNFIAPETVTFRRTVAVAWCSYSHIIQLRSWLPDEVGGVCWMSVDNPAQTPRVPIFCGNTKLPEAYNTCGQMQFDENSVLWKYRKTNKLATVQWQSTKALVNGTVTRFEDEAFAGLADLEKSVKDNGSAKKSAKLLNAYTEDYFTRTTEGWKQLEQKLWLYFGMGF
ncbi:MAG: C69 family dipeptidase [Bacteroidales bacterium]|nr:C69 family dipeptidase [Bacteroidales bacterium]